MVTFKYNFFSNYSLIIRLGTTKFIFFLTTLFISLKNRFSAYHQKNVISGHYGIVRLRAVKYWFLGTGHHNLWLILLSSAGWVSSRNIDNLIIWGRFDQWNWVKVNNDKKTLSSIYHRLYPMRELVTFHKKVLFRNRSFSVADVT